MNAQTKVEAPTLALLRVPFSANHISKLPKPTKAQTDAVKADFKAGIRCKDCGAWHHPDVQHLDYVGHAALTDRLLDVDPEWTWEPVAFTEAGLPAFDAGGGLWIRLTVLNVTRLGYGHAASKQNADPGAREKEVIGDALRNAAMRFGAALDLWHKGDLHADEVDQAVEATPANNGRAKIDDTQWACLTQLIEAKGVDTRDFCRWLKVPSLRDIDACDFFRAKEALTKKPDKAKPVEETLADGVDY